MSRQLQSRVALLLLGLMLATGCTPTQPFYFHEDGDLSHYLDKATKIDYPDVESGQLADAHQSEAPLTLTNPDFKDIWELSLEECMHITMQNSKVIRNIGGITPSGFGADGVLQRTAGASTIYDPSITETDRRSPFASSTAISGPINFPISAQTVGGVEGALADFDAQLSMTGNTGQSGESGAIAYHQDRATNANFFNSINDLYLGGMETRLFKRSASGARFSLANETSYDRWNRTQSEAASFRKLNSFWTTQFTARYDQPLMRGRGTAINRIPLMLARINTDISLVNFETSVRDLTKNVEDVYWDLHYAYRRLDTTKTGRDSALVTWRIAFEKWQEGVEPVQAEAESRGQYFAFRAAVEEALRDLYATENRLRYLMGLAASDGRLIRPKDEPSMARVNFDWSSIRTEALVRSPELRQQKWSIKQRELELMSAKNQLLPQLDAGLFYRWVGLGDDLIEAGSSGKAFATDRAGATGTTAFEELTLGNYQEAGFIFNFQMPVGFRRELAGVRNAQLQLARAKAVQEDMELSQVHLLSTSVRTLDANYVLAQTHFNRLVAAEKEVESVQALYQGGKTTIDRVLDAQRRRAEAMDAHYRAIAEYNKSIADVHFRKGSLLEYNNVFLAEGPWPQKAYWDALGHARERDASHYLDYGYTRPGVISRGEMQQHGFEMSDDFGPPGEIIESPQPTPAAEDLPAEAEGDRSLLPVPSDDNPPVPDGLVPMPESMTDIGPALNAPVLPVASAAPSNRSAKPAARFDWHGLDSTTRRGGERISTGVRPVSFEESITDGR